jgi:hypothetical protein
MSSQSAKKPVRISMDDVARAAAAGVERALDARKAAGVELSTDEVDEVSGGAYTFGKDIGIIAGGIPNDYLLQKGFGTPVVDAGGLASGGLAIG